MADIDLATIHKIAHLAKLQITEEEAKQYVPQIQKILSHFDELKELNTDHIEPLFTPVQIEPTLRPDAVTSAVDHEQIKEKILDNAPDRMGQLFKVPPVV